MKQRYISYVIHLCAEAGPKSKPINYLLRSSEAVGASPLIIS